MEYANPRRGRPPIEPSKRRLRHVQVCLTDAGVDAVDEMRGTTSRSTFIRNLIVAEYARRKR